MPHSRQLYVFVDYHLLICSLVQMLVKSVGYLVLGSEKGTARGKAVDLAVSQVGKVGGNHPHRPGRQFNGLLGLIFLVINNCKGCVAMACGCSFKCPLNSAPELPVHYLVPAAHLAHRPPGPVRHEHLGDHP